MIRLLYSTTDGQVVYHPSVAQITKIQQIIDNTYGMLWVDIYQEPYDRCEELLSQCFKFHPLAVDDALCETHTPKIDDWNEYLFMEFSTIDFIPDDEEPFKSAELAIFLGKHYLVTYHKYAMSQIDSVLAASQRDHRIKERGAIYLLYRLLDDLISSYMIIVDKVDNYIDTIEDEIFENPRPETLENIFSTKRTLLLLRQQLMPQRELLNKLSRGDYDVVDHQQAVYFRDLYDHIVRLNEITESLRDLIGSALDSYMSMINNRMSEIMKTLTVITTLFMPLSFITGFFGMNYFQSVLALNAWTGELSLTVTLGLIILLPLGMFLWMRHRGFL